jgi:hypothetical protein
MARIAQKQASYSDLSTTSSIPPRFPLKSLKQQRPLGCPLVVGVAFGGAGVGEARKFEVVRWNGILAWFDSQLSNGFLEAVNGLIQAAKRRARGYRTTKNLINMAYLIAGKLDFRLPI